MGYNHGEMARLPQLTAVIAAGLALALAGVMTPTARAQFAIPNPLVPPAKSVPPPALPPSFKPTIAPVAPVRPAPAPPAPGKLPAPTPGPSVTVNAPVRGQLTLETTLARLLQALGDFTATGDLEIQTGEGAGLQRQLFPVTLQMLAGRLRLELSLRHVKTDQLEGGEFTVLRQVGVDRVVTIALPHLRVQHLVYPAIGSYVTQSLPDEALPSGYRLDRQLVGPESLQGKTFNKYRLTMTHLFKDVRQSVDWWETVPHQPAFLKMAVGGALISIRFRDIARQKPQPELFEVPIEFFKHPDRATLLVAATRRPKVEQQAVLADPAK